MKSLIIHKIVPIFLLYFCLQPFTSAQFYGGIGNGHDKSSTIQITLNGNQINALAMYRGGQSDGHNKNENSLSLNGAEISQLYKGGSDDGFTKFSFSGTLAGANLDYLYLGGNGDGASKDLFVGLLDGAEIAQLYSGGNGDGADKNLFIGVLDGAEITQLYAGGDGDGTDKDIFVGILDGGEISQLYSGGNGDGANKNFFAGTMDGADISNLYKGGNGDGFNKHIIQYIFDFPGCTFVVNTDDSGFGSLRYAINCAAPGDTIDFSPLLLQDSITLTSDQLTIEKNLYINANKSSEITVDAGLVSRAFKLGFNTISIKGLKIIIGTEPSGGAVLNNGILTLIDVDIYDPLDNSNTVIQMSMTGSLTIRGDVNIFEN